MIRRTLAALAVIPLLALAGCGSADEPSTAGVTTATTTATSSEPALTGTVTVFAAASLTEVFTALGTSFEAEHPGVTVTFNFGSSATLATQLTQGAPADVFASASTATMQTVVDAAANVGDPVTFVTNTLQIAVPAGNPAGVTGLSDFANPDLTIALCDVSVPCGAAATKVFEAAGITAMPDSLETDVKAALTKVELGEVDAALVYRTDVLAGGDQVEGIDFPESAEAVNAYPIVSLAAATNPDGAAAFMAYVLSDAGIAALKDAGFQLP